MARVVKKERGVARRRMNGVIQSEFRKRKEGAPAFHRVNEAVEDIFQDAIDAFSLTVRLGMSGGGH